MVSDFRKKKLLHVFTAFFDTNGSGTVDKKDFELAVERISKIRGWSPGDAKYKAAETTLMKVWDGLQSGADANKDGEITQDEWIAMWDASATAEWQNLYCKFVFEVEDFTDDGSIDSEEFASLYAAFGLNKDEAVAAFKKMAQGKSSVSWSEFQGLWKEYFASEDAGAPGNGIFGKTSY